MRFGFVDKEGVGVSWASRVFDEGHEVLYYTPHDGASRNAGENIIPRTHSMVTLFQWAKQKPTIVVYFMSGMGTRQKGVPISVQDFLDADIPVVGGGEFMDKLEQDRVFGSDIAKQIGCHIPETKEFSTVSQAIAFAKTQKDEWYFK